MLALALPVLAIWLTRYDLIPIPGSDFGGPWGIIGFIGFVGFLVGLLWRSLWPFAVLFVVWIGYSVIGLTVWEETGRTSPEVSIVIASLLGFIPAMIGGLIGAAVGALIGKVYR